MPDAKAEWGVLASELGLLLFRLKKDGLMAINHYKLRRLKQKARSLEMVERLFALQRNDAKSSGDGGSDSAGKAQDI